MKTHRHVEHILSISYKRLWAIRKLSKACVPPDDILHFYFMKIRSVLESNCVVYHSMLTQDNVNDIERVQKIVLKVILDDQYVDYHHACLSLNLQTLQVRRTKLSLNFGLKCIASEKFSHLFQLNSHISIRNPDRFDVPFAKTSRYLDSPKFYLTRLLNSYFRNEETP